jgi:predicted heme/steroid binding protein
MHKKEILIAVLFSGLLLFGCMGEEGSGTSGGSGASGSSGGEIWEVWAGAGEGGLHPGESPYESGREILLAEVEQHDSLGDCWMAIHGKVYDMDAYISSHPGGDAILQGCGKDATTLFETRPMGSGTPHSDYARGVLGEHYVGELAGWN